MQGGFNQGLGVGAGTGLQGQGTVQQGGIIQQGGVIHQGGSLGGGSLGNPGIGTTILGSTNLHHQGGVGLHHGVHQGVHQEGFVQQGFSTIQEAPTTVYQKVTTVTQPQEVHILHSAPVQQQVAQPISSTEQYAQEALLRGVAPAGVNDHAGGLGLNHGGYGQATGVNLTQTPYFSGTQPLVYQGNVPQVSSHGAHHAGGLITGQDPNLINQHHGVGSVPIGTAGVLQQQSLGTGANLGVHNNLGTTGGVYNPQN